jgi:cytoskeletal protein CcmA (bactofilin family)
MTRKISGRDGDLVVNTDVELDGQITGRLVVEPGGSAVIRGSMVGPTLTVGGEPADHDPHHDLDEVIADIP